MDTKEKIEFYKEWVIDSGSESLAQARSTLEKAVIELKRFEDRYKESDTLNDKADQLNWALNHLVSNIISNCRIDMIASAQAKLNEVSAMEKMINKEISNDKV